MTNQEINKAREDALKLAAGGKDFKTLNRWEIDAIAKIAAYHLNKNGVPHPTGTRWNFNKVQVTI